MSLVVARKEGNQIAIVSDTKLTLPEREIKELNFEEVEIKIQQSKPVDSVLKTVILNPNLSVSFAGEIDYAEQAIKELQKNFNTDQTIKVLYEHHVRSEQKTEFLVCSFESVPIINEIKNYYSKEVHSSWLGDQKAFNSFQESYLGTKPKSQETAKADNVQSKAGIVITSMNLNIEVDAQLNSFSKMASAMDEVIEDANVNSVGGFRVMVIYKEKFDYAKYLKNYRSNVELYGSGYHVIGHGSANEGAYSINFVGASNDFETVALHIKQGNFGIIYNRKENGLLKPELLKLDEVDFCDYLKEQYNLLVGIVTQDKVQKFINDGLIAFNDKDFKKASALFDRGLNDATGKKKAELLYYKGICFLNLREITLAMQNFQQAINIDSSYQQKIIQLLAQRK